MSKTYTLIGTLSGGRQNSWSSNYWTNVSLNQSNISKKMVGKYEDKFHYQSIMFDHSTLSALRNKSVTSIKLVLGINGTVPGYETLIIGYKYTAEQGGTASNNNWARSNADSTEAATTVIAYITSGNAAVSGSDYTFDITGSVVPKYGYALGLKQNTPNDTYLYITSATLIVTTNESITLSFSANGGTGAPNSQTADGSPSHTFTIPSTAPIRTYYTFLGWSTSSSASSASYQPGGSINIENSTTLYAVWSRNTAYVYYNANGGTGAPPTQSHSAGTPVTLSSAKPTRTGYTFLGWSASSEATASSYSAGGTYDLYTTTTLYAVWKVITYTVSYNANGGTGAPSAQTKTYGVALTLSPVAPTRMYYTFLGWSTSNSAESATYQPGGVFSANENATLYAVWRLNASAITLSYNANGGTGAPSAQTQTAVSPISFAVSLSIPARVGYTFLGWDPSPTAKTPSRQPGDIISLTSDLQLYAVWQKIVYTITYNASGGTGAPGPMQKEHGESINLSEAIPTKNGYAFLGWDTSVEGKTVVYRAGAIYAENASAILYAVWERLSYVVHYDANGGVGSSPDQVKLHGEGIVLSGVEPARSGYQFFGWSIYNDVLFPDYAFGDEYADDANITLYAVWRRLYTISYDANGGFDAPADQSKMQLVDINLSTETPTRPDKTFMAWRGSDGILYAPGQTYHKDDDIALMAVWNNFNNGSAFVVKNGTAVPVDVYVVQNGLPARKDFYV